MTLRDRVGPAWGCVCPRPWAGVYVTLARGTGGRGELTGRHPRSLAFPDPSETRPTVTRPATARREASRFRPGIRRDTRDKDARFKANDVLTLPDGMLGVVVVRAKKVLMVNFCNLFQ